MEITETNHDNLKIEHKKTMADPDLENKNMLLDNEKPEEREINNNVTEDVEKVDKKERRRFGCTNFLHVFLIIMNVVLIVSLLGLVAYWRTLRYSFLKPVEHVICQPCTDIGLDGEELPNRVAGNISRKEKDGQLECCGKAGFLLDWMIEQAVERRHNDYYGGMYPLVSDSCSQTLQEVPLGQVNGLSDLQLAEKHDKIHWNHTDGAFFKGGVHYRHGIITVTKPGFYYIFSQIKVKLPSLPDSDGTTQSFEMQDNSTIWHRIYRHSPLTGQKGILLESAKSRCEYQTSEDGEVTNFMGTVFKLEENDKLHVDTSRPENLVQSREANFFGLYMT